MKSIESTPEQKADNKRKFLIISMALVVANLIISLISEKLPRILISSYDAYRDKGIIDGINSDKYLLIVNAIMVVFSILIIVYLMCKKSSKFRTRCGAILIVLLLLLVPVIMVEKSGGISGIDTVIYLPTLFCLL